MIPTKGEIINDAYSQLRISGLTVDATGKEKETALNRLEGMAAEFEGRNICINYIFEELPDTSTSTGVSLQFQQMLATNLAVRLIPDFGKNSQQSPSLMDLKKQANQSLSNASARTAKVNRTNYPDRMPVGSGNTFRLGNKWRRFYREAGNPVISCETKELPLNSIASYVVSWSNFLADGETIASFIIESTSGLTVSEAAIQNSSTEIFYKALGTSCGAQTVTISIVTTSSAPENADTETINFNVIDNLS